MKEKTKNLIILRGANAQTHANRIELTRTQNNALFGRCVYRCSLHSFSVECS